jgi:opacity protein-like surface antigen
MAKTLTARQFLSLAILVPVLGAVGVGEAHAQGFISPFIGYNFGGDSGCPQISNCEDKHADYGVSVGALGPIVGFEAEFAYTPDFFGKASLQTSNVLVITGNFMLAPKFGPVQPFGLIGLGLMRTSVESGGTTNDQNQFTWDGGGGLMVFFGEHIGIRGDIRYYHSFQALDRIALPNLDPVLGGQKLNFGRTGVAVVFKF